MNRQFRGNSFYYIQHAQILNDYRINADFRKFFHKCNQFFKLTVKHHSIYGNVQFRIVEVAKPYSLF